MTVLLSQFAGAGQQFFTNAGVPLAGGLIYSYGAGGSTPLATYTTSAGNIQHSNPIQLDAAGRVPGGGEIWLTSNLAYKFLIKDSGGSTIQTLDNVGGGVDGATLASSSGSSLVGFIQAGTGAVLRTAQSKMRERVSVLDFGADPTGVTDSTIAIQTAINSSDRKRVFFPKGVYLVTDTLSINLLSYSWEGERTERGQNALAFRDEYSATRIVFNPTDKTKFLVNIFEPTSGLNTIGPFEHKNLTFLIDGANGFQFGNESLPINDGPGGQAYVFGVRFDNCAFQTQNTNDSFASDSIGVMTFSGKRAIGLCKAFESVVQDVSFQGGDYGVRTLGCDKPTLRNIRSYCMRPADFVGSGSFTVQHTVDNFQSEGWAISPIRNFGVELAVSNSRFEVNIGNPVGAGRFVLPACTATVTANSGTLTFSRSMDNILIPGWSLIELTDGTETDVCLVTAVSATSVTINTSNFRFTWSGTATTVTRIHNFGPLHNSFFASTYNNIAAGAKINCPAFVYVGSRAPMNINNAGAETGTYGNIECLAVGNRASAEQQYMNSQMSLTNCSSLLTPSVPSPLVSVENWREAQGIADKSQNRQFGADAFDSLNKALRKWIYTPARYQTSINNRQTITFKRINGDAGTSQRVFAWFLDGSDPNGRNLDIYDDSLPSATAGCLQILVRAKSVAGTPTIAVQAASNLGGATLQTLTISTTWQTYVVTTAVPTEWGSGGTSLRLLRLVPSADVYVSAVAVLDENPNANETYISNGVSKGMAHKQVTLTSGSGQVIARGTGPNSSFKIKAWGYAGGAVLGYASVYGEFIVQTSTYSGTYAVRGVSTLYKQQQSISAPVVDVDIAITAAVVSGATEMTATTTITGSAGATQAIFRFEIEGIGAPGIIVTAA